MTSSHTDEVWPERSEIRMLPTLRSLATRQATEGTLRKVGVTDEHCEAEVNEAAAMQAKRSVDAIRELLPIESRTEF